MAMQCSTYCRVGIIFMCEIARNAFSSVIHLCGFGTNVCWPD